MSRRTGQLRVCSCCPTATRRRQTLARCGPVASRSRCGLLHPRTKYKAGSPGRLQGFGSLSSRLGSSSSSRRAGLGRPIPLIETVSKEKGVRWESGEAVLEWGHGDTCSGGGLMGRVCHSISDRLLCLQLRLHSYSWPCPRRAPSRLYSTRWSRPTHAQRESVSTQ